MRMATGGVDVSKEEECMTIALEKKLFYLIVSHHAISSHTCILSFALKMYVKRPRISSEDPFYGFHAKDLRSKLVTKQSNEPSRVESNQLVDALRKKWAAAPGQKPLHEVGTPERVIAMLLNPW
jgi:hypothetical protein